MHVAVPTSCIQSFGAMTRASMLFSLRRLSAHHVSLKTPVSKGVCAHKGLVYNCVLDTCALRERYFDNKLTKK